MTPQQQVEKQLQQEVQTFSNEIYKGEVETPSNLVDLFKSAVLKISPYSHKINFYKIRSIASKNVSHLTVDDISEIVKVILNVPLEKMYIMLDFEHIVEQQIKLQKFILAYNQYVDDFKQKMEMKRVTLLQLASASKNGMKIIS